MLSLRDHGLGPGPTRAGATRVRMTRTATDRVVKVNRSLSQISARSPPPGRRRRVLRLHRATRSAALPVPWPLPRHRSARPGSAGGEHVPGQRGVRAVESSRSADRDRRRPAVVARSSTMRSRSLPSCSRSASRSTRRGSRLDAVLLVARRWSRCRTRNRTAPSPGPRRPVSPGRPGPRGGAPLLEADHVAAGEQLGDRGTDRATPAPRKLTVSRSRTAAACS